MNIVARYKLLRFWVEIVMPHDKVTEDVMTQVQEFMLDEFDVEDLRWDHFDVRALRMGIDEEHPNVSWDQDDSPEPERTRKLDTGDA